MHKKISHLPYRNNISCIVFKDRKFLLVQRTGWPKHFWKFPQGGVNNGEAEETAARRELMEELGTDKFKFIAKSSNTNLYDWTDDAVRKAGNKWRGQLQKFFLVEYLGSGKDIKTDKNEIQQHLWVDEKDLFSHIDHNNKNFTNYKNTIKKILLELKEHLA